MQQILDNPSRVLDLIWDVAEREILPRFRSLRAHEIDEKRPGDLVTVADRDSEQAFRRHLPDLLPGSVVLGEEGYETDPACLKLLAGDDPVWIVDPVDGTHNFAHGTEPFTVIVALALANETIAGWIADPMAGEAVFAVKGEGAALAQRQSPAAPIAITRPGAFADATMTAGAKLKSRLERAADEMEVALPRIVPRYRCVGREYMDVATGKLDFARYGGRLKPWDHAAGCLIVREGGGRADEIAPQMPYQARPSLTSESIGIAGNKALWQPFRALMLHADGLNH